MLDMFSDRQQPADRQSQVFSGIARIAGEELDWYYGLFSTGGRWTNNLGAGYLHRLYDLRTEADGVYQKPVDRLAYAFYKLAAIQPILELSRNLPEVKQVLDTQFSGVLNRRSRTLLRLLVLAEAWDETSIRRLGRDGQAVIQGTPDYQQQGQQLDGLAREAAAQVVTPEKIKAIAERFAHSFDAEGGIPRILPLKRLVGKLLSTNPAQSIQLSDPYSDFRLQAEIQYALQARAETLQIWQKRRGAMDEIIQRREQYERQNPERARVEKLAEAFERASER